MEIVIFKVHQNICLEFFQMLNEKWDFLHLLDFLAFCVVTWHDKNGHFVCLFITYMFNYVNQEFLLFINNNASLSSYILQEVKVAKEV